MNPDQQFVLMVAIDTLIKSTIVLALGLLTWIALHKAQASLRHAILAATLFTLPLLPLAIVFLPPINTPTPLQIFNPDLITQAESTHFKSDQNNTVSDPYRQESVEMSPYNYRNIIDLAHQRSSKMTVIQLDTDSKSNPVRVIRLCGFIWLAGTVATTAYVLAGTLFMRRLLPFAADSSAEQQEILESTLSRIGIKRKVRLRKTDRNSCVPLTFGALNPVILIPSSASSWPESQLRAVLTHEAAHIKRSDWLIQTSTYLICAALWFHPLAWIVYNRLRSEAELACDDIVVNCGIAPTEYSRSLVDIVKQTFNNSSPIFDAVAIVRSSDISCRITSLLNPQINRGPINKRIKLSIALTIIVLFAPIALLKIDHSESKYSVTYAESDSHSPSKHVSILGISILNNESEGWWDKAGKRLAKAPESPFIPVGSISGSSNDKAYHFVLDVRGLPADQSLAKYIIQNATATTMYSGPSSGPSKNIFSVGAEIPSSQTTCDMRIGIENGNWRTVDSTPVSSATGSVSTSSGTNTLMIATTPTLQGQHDFSVAASYSINDQAQRLVGIDKTAAIVVPSSTGSSQSGKMGMQVLIFKGLKQTDIKVIELQQRPYEWTDINNIALVPSN